MTISELKKEAKIKLSGKFGKILAITLIFSILFLALEKAGQFITDDLISSIYNFIILIITTPFSFGFLASMVKLSRDEDVSLFDFISIGLANLYNVWKVVGRTILKLLLPILLIIVSTIALVLSSYFSISSHSSNANIYLLISLILFFGSFIYYIVKILSYVLTNFILFDNPEFTGKEIVEKSQLLMKGNKLKYILLCLSFIGWYLLISILNIIVSSLTTNLSIISIFTTLCVSLLIPYMSFSMITFYEDLNNNKKSENDVNENVSEQSSETNNTID